MRTTFVTSVVIAAEVVSAAPWSGWSGHSKGINVQLGPRPYALVNDMDAGPLKDELKKCFDQPQKTSTWSIGHRGACLQFPEHSKESYEAAARTGAGTIECDVAFTSDLELVCRHSHCVSSSIVRSPFIRTHCILLGRPFITDAK